MAGNAYPAAALPAERRFARQTRPGLRAPLLLAALCVLALALVWGVAAHVQGVRVADARLLHDFTLIESGRINSAAQKLLSLLNPAQFAIWALAIVLFALARERPRLALAIVFVVTLGPFTAELLKPLLAVSHVSIGEDRPIGAASWPSGHATAATVLALSAVLVVPARWRSFALVPAAAFLLAVGASLLIRAWHMPSDVLGGYLLGTFWTALALAAVRASERRWPSRAARRRAGDEAKPDAEGARGEHLAPLHGRRAEV
ncbi:MAG TPA: phosphatase PAP2 family protein [Solirubrobacteraceae bacterium]